MAVKGDFFNAPCVRSKGSTNPMSVVEVDWEALAKVERLVDDDFGLRRALYLAGSLIVKSSVPDKGVVKRVGEKGLLEMHGLGVVDSHAQRDIKGELGGF